MNIIGFFKFNQQKRLTVKAYFYSAIYRLLILTQKPKYLHKLWGIEGEESAEDVKPWQYRYAQNVSIVVNRICNKTKWESKCLVRAWTAQTLLKQKGISSTLYLGCAMEEGKMVAHAWIRCGRMYVTGGDGTGYAMVDKFSVY